MAHKKRRQRRSARDLEALVTEAVVAYGYDRRRFDALVGQLERDPGAALMIAERLMGEALHQLWQRGWSPAEAVHVVDRRAGRAAGTALAEIVLTALHAGLDPGLHVHPRWSAQLAELGHRIEHPPRSEPGDRLPGVVAAAGVISTLPAVMPTVPPPGAAPFDTDSGDVRIDSRVLARVRSLLAKAESTEFDEEAEALAAKAQQLIAAHSIDAAALAADDLGSPDARRLLLEDPYADAKAHLVSAVASANRCRVVHDRDFGWVTVFGYVADLDSLDLLTTSLLAQASAAMLRHGPQHDALGRSRTRSFRRAFLLGYAKRIGERLRAATQAEEAQADQRLLPVLADRHLRVDHAVTAAFPNLQRRVTTVSHAGGWQSGHRAADDAELNVAHRRLRST